MILAPVFFALMTISFPQQALLPVSIILLILFVVSEVTDVLDGHIARKYDMVTDLGKVLDPFSDVLSRLTFFIAFSVTGYMPVFLFLIIMYREFCQTFLRMLSMKNGVVVPANSWGKIKAVFYSISSGVGMAFFFIKTNGYLESVWDVAKIVTVVLFSLAAFFSVISFMTYLIPFWREYKNNLSKL
jgi:CDP-diacylglycerol--glycerol-3-phosphate 3-phosphatidyltransferase